MKKRRDRLPKKIVHTNIPINRMSEVEEEKRKRLPGFAAEAWDKEFNIKNAQGPHSIPEPHYPKSFFIKKGE